jgi:uncharacterized protein (DUF362 family)
MDILNCNRVSAIKVSEAVYPAPPYHPSSRYPEFPLIPVSKEPNFVFDAVRQSLHALALDSCNFGSSSWNPLGVVVKPGQTVIIKPNLVSHFNWGYKNSLTDTDSLITHGSVIRCIIDYVALALKDNGRVIIGDSPVQLGCWNSLLRLIHFEEIVDHCKTYYPGVALTSCDFRLETGARSKFGAIIQKANQLRQHDFIEIDLRDKSLLADLQNPGKVASFGVTDYPAWRMRDAHNTFYNKYLFPKQVLEADTLISLPKLKTHSKAGFTCALKNMVGINGLKDYLPHFRYGPPRRNGDEYPENGLLFDLINRLSHKVWDSREGSKKSFYALTTKALKGLYLFLGRKNKAMLSAMGGGWYGNDTLWRTILDINRSFFYADGTGSLSEGNICKKNYITVVDGIVGGERLAPLLPTPVKSGFIIAGINPVAVDSIAATLMGLDYKKLKQVTRALLIDRYPLIGFTPEDIALESNFDCRSIKDIVRTRAFVPFEPSPGYKGHVELAEI